jgi:hypothetical protein
MVLSVQKIFKIQVLAALLLSTGVNAGVVTAQAPSNTVSPTAVPAPPTSPQQPASTNSSPSTPATTAAPVQPASGTVQAPAAPGTVTTTPAAPVTGQPVAPAAPGQPPAGSTTTTPAAPATTVAPGTGQTATPAAPGQPSTGSPPPSVSPSPQYPVIPNFAAGQRTPRITIPEASAITVTFCSTVRFDSKHRSIFPVVAYLARPVMDNNGNVLAPVNSLVNAQLKPTKEGVQVSVDALVVGGRFVPIKTAQLPVPMLSKTDQQNNYSYSYNDDNLGIAFNVANGLQEWLTDQEILSDSFGDVLGAGLTVAAGVSRARSRPKNTQVMEVPQGSTLVFPLMASVSLPSMPLQALAAPAQPGAVCSNSPPGGSSSSYSSYGSSYGSGSYNNGSSYNNGNSYNQAD